MGEIVELKTKAKVVDDTAAKTWSPVDCLKSCIEDIENNKEIAPTHIYIAMLVPEGDGQRIAFAQAGMDTVFETIAMLKIHGDYHASQWFDVVD